MAASGPVSRLPGSCKSNKTSRSLIDNKPGLGIFCFEFFVLRLQVFPSPAILSELDIFTQTSPDNFGLSRPVTTWENLDSSFQKIFLCLC